MRATVIFSFVFYMQILFEDYIRYRKEKIRERLKSAVTEQFMAAHPEMSLEEADKALTDILTSAGLL